MSSCSMTGFRFYPTEEELISFYLHHQLNATPGLDTTEVIPVLDIFQTEPWNLPKLSGRLCRKDMEQWFFFSPIQERVAAGCRPCRSTPCGYWKATGSPGYVYSSDNKVIGLKKSMVFYQGKAPHGSKTKWKMNEYKAITFQDSATNNSVPKLRHEMTVCRVYTMTGSARSFDRRPLGPENHCGSSSTAAMGAAPPPEFEVDRSEDHPLFFADLDEDH